MGEDFDAGYDGLLNWKLLRNFNHYNREILNYLKLQTATSLVFHHIVYVIADIWGRSSTIDRERIQRVLITLVLSNLC